MTVAVYWHLYSSGAILARFGMQTSRDRELNVAPIRAKALVSGRYFIVNEWRAGLHAP